MKVSKLFTALEEETSPSVQAIETEIVVYCRIQNFDGLKKASSVEHHEQLETCFEPPKDEDKAIRCRTRRVQTSKDLPDLSYEQEYYEFTYKLPVNSEDGFEANQEITTAIDKDFHEGFRQIAKHRLDKTRYEFASDKIILTFIDQDERQDIEISGVTYEVDVYQDKEGTVCEWCKIDIEVDSILDYLAQHHADLQNIKLNIKITHLPFEPTDMILASSATDEQSSFIDTLWKMHWQLPTAV